MQTPDKVLDICVIGAGPAGLQAGYFFQEKGLDFKILERGAVGEFFRRFPRHRQLISINKVHTGLSNPETRLRHDWNSLMNAEGELFTDRTGKYFPNADHYVTYLEDFAGLLGDRIETGCEVTRISKAEGVFAVDCADGRSVQARTVIVATGVSLPFDPKIEGGEHAVNYFDLDPDPSRYDGKRVLILGKGNSAFETADALVEHAASIHVMSPEPIKFAWQTHFVGHLRAVNNNFLDTYQLKSQNAVIDAEVVRIEETHGVYTVTAAMKAAEGHEIVLNYDEVIACTGFRYDNSIFDAAIRPGLRRMDKFPAMGPTWESEEVEGLFFAGTITQSLDFKKTMSGFVHGFRHNVRRLVDFVESRLTGEPLAAETAPLEPAALTDQIIDRISTGSGIFLQPGFLGDVVVLDGPKAGSAYRDVPIAWAVETDAFAGRAFLTVTLEYGDFGDNSLHVKRQHNVFGDKPDAFIHPVIRYWRRGEVVDQIHLADHLDADWRRPEDRDAGAGTVLAMTFKDAGETLPPGVVAERQIRAFLERTGLDLQAANDDAAVQDVPRTTAAE